MSRRITILFWNVRIILLALIVLISLIGTFPTALGFFFIPGLNYQTIQVFNINASAPLGLTPSQGVLYNFTVPDDAKNIYLKGSVSVSGGTVSTITISLYDSSQCPPPDSEGNIDWSSCTGVYSYDYSSGDDIEHYIPHGGTFYLYTL